MASPLLENLNPEQLAAVTLPHASALILAGAGSGKTRVLTTRIAWLLATGQASPLSVLAVTFTNKAAKEMLTRLAALTPVNTRGMWVGTFHGLCNRMLRAHYRDAGLPQLFQIMDMQDQLALSKRVYKAHNIDDDRFPARTLQAFVNDAKESGLRPNQVEAGDEVSRRQVEHYALYEQACNREGVVDFPELLLRSYELLSRNDSLREHYRRRFSHVLVDEFQDTNVLQYKWLQILTGPHTAVFAVGDDDQSIYAFRGANVANMQHFERDFGTAETPVKLIKLEQNYRSHRHILDAANALIKNNQGRLGKNLWTSDARGEPVRAFAAPSDIDDASFIRQIESMRETTRVLTLPQTVEHVVHASGLLSHYGAEKDGQDRIDNLQELVAAADSFMREAEREIGEDIGDPLTGFLAHAALEAGETQAAEGRPALQLMTVHSAKGLEFHTVFVTGLEEGLFPHENSLSEYDGLEEERRLAYVAVTRARRRLYHTHAQSRMLHGQVRYNVASRFLDELPVGTVQWLSPKAGRDAREPAPSTISALHADL